MTIREKSDAIRIGNRVTIRKRGKRGIYTADFWHDGQHRRRSLRTTKRKVARSRGVDLERELELGEFKLAPAAIPVIEAVSRYLQYLQTEGRARRTLTRYRGELNGLAEFLRTRGRSKLSAVRMVDLDAWRAVRSKIVARRTLYHEGIVAKQFFAWCHARNLTSFNPVANYRVAEPERCQMPVPALGDVWAILEASSQQARPLFRLLAYTGIRVGELQGLRCEDVDVRSGFIQVRRQVHGPTKTRNQRRIPIHDDILDLLKTQLSASMHELLFTALPSNRYPDGGRPVSTKRLNERFKAACGRAGLSGLTQHSLRRFFTTHMINSGVPERIVRIWLGHADRTTTGRYYQLADDEAQRFMNNVSFGQNAAARISEGG